MFLKYLPCNKPDCMYLHEVGKYHRSVRLHLDTGGNVTNMNCEREDEIIASELMKQSLVLMDRHRLFLSDINVVHVHGVNG
jgi:hypothetical protein